jgi:hypothetical protein
MLGTIFFNGNMIEDNIDKLTTLKSLSWLEAETNNFIGTLPEAFIELPYLCKLMFWFAPHSRGTIHSSVHFYFIIRESKTYKQQFDWCHSGYLYECFLARELSCLGQQVYRRVSALLS